MPWRVRTTLDDRPGILAEVAQACGRAGLNIVSMQVFGIADRVTDEFVVDGPLDEVAVAEVFAQAGGTDVAVTRIDDGVIVDAPTRYLEAVHQVLEEGRDVEEVLRELLATEPPDVADYAGHDVLDLVRRGGTTLRISRAVPFTPAERSRAQALLSLVSDAGADLPLIAPSTTHPIPLVREATLADIDAVAALHSRCSVETLYARYQTPLRMPMTTRLARRLVVPEQGVALVAQAGLDVVGHAVLEPGEPRWTAQVLVEDAWAHRGIGTMLVRQAAAAARAAHSEALTFLSAGSNDALLRSVGSAGFVARVERRDEVVHITVPLRG
ncbi:GNAT family N-acetyltransferase [Aeromicrobium sp. Leaf350]|uniref:GNAT family N-acetyltransferase n=1 Tax=Aeromicrobium sp. Leaf350 TaxID=2876565 RepID=UPI001E44387B|nr:GNAT family N-acetyltransferase [Aeromicrobium sp. Leaf350]